MDDDELCSGLGELSRRKHVDLDKPMDLSWVDVLPQETPPFWKQISFHLLLLVGDYVPSRDGGGEGPTERDAGPK